MTRKNSNFYNVRFKKVGINEELAASVLGVTVEEVKKFDRDGAPLMAERLLMLWSKKHVGHENWKGWYFSRGCLCKGRLRWRPENIINDREFRNKLEDDTAGMLRNFSAISLVNSK